VDQSVPRKGSICLPTGINKLRLLLMLGALVTGGVSGALFYLAFAETAEAIAIGVTATDIAFHVVEIALSLYTVSHPAPAQTSPQSPVAAPGARPAAPLRHRAGGRALRTVVARAQKLAARVRRFFDPFNGFGGTPAPAVRTYG
jgi:hypothetical protein